MEKYILVKQIIKMCNYFKVFNKNEDYYYLEKMITDGLEDIIFVENLLTVFYQKMKYKRFQKNLNIKKFKQILIELEKIRLNLEFKGVEL